MFSLTQILKRPRNLEPYIFILGLFALGFLIHMNGLHNPFVLDDLSKVVDNQDLRISGWNLFERLIYPYTDPPILTRNDPSRPLVFFFYTLIYKINGVDPYFFRLFNVLLHCLNASLLFLLLREKFFRELPKLAPIIISVLFLSSPVNNGTVQYVFSLSDLLGALFCLGTLLLYLRKYFWLAALTFACALASKQSAIVVLFFIAAIESFNLKRLKLFLALAFLFLLSRFVYFGGLGDLEAVGLPSGNSLYLMSQGTSIWRYIEVVFWPQQLAIDHFIRNIEVHFTSSLFNWLAFCFVFLWFFINRKKTTGHHYCFLGILIFFVCLSPVSTFVPTVDFFVERRVYLASIGLFIPTGYFLGKALSYKRAYIRNAVASFLVLAISLGAAYSTYRNSLFSTIEGVWMEVLAQYPTSPRALNNLASHYTGQGNFEQGRKLFERLTILYIDDAYSRANLGVIYSNTSAPFFDLQKAEYWLREAVKIPSPELKVKYFDLARVLQLQGKTQEAQKYYEDFLTLEPMHLNAWNNLGVLHMKNGDFDKSKYCFEKALSIDPQSQLAQDNLSDLSGGAKRKELRSIDPKFVAPEIIIETYVRALKEDPTNKTLKKALIQFCKERRVTCPKM